MAKPRPWVGTPWGVKGHLGRAYPDQPSGEVDDGASAVAWVNGGVRLYKVLVFNVIDRDIAFDRAEHAAADRAAVADGVAHHDDSFA